MDENQYKVVRQLDDVMPEAATAHKAGVSFDVRLYFRAHGRNPVAGRAGARR
jgi:hypothetical protein